MNKQQLRDVLAQLRDGDLNDLDDEDGEIGEHDDFHAHSSAWMRAAAEADAHREAWRRRRGKDGPGDAVPVNWRD